jgi:hypothetical protein
MCRDLTIKVSKIVILQNSRGLDSIIIHSLLPAATYPFSGLETLTIKCASMSGVEYCRKHFDSVGVPIEIIAM